MARLAHSDLDELRDFLRGATAYERVDAFDEGVLGGLARLVPCDLAAYREIDLATGRVREWFIPPDADRRADHDAGERRLAAHPVVRAHASGDTQALRLGDLIDSRRLHRTALYDEVLHPLGIEWEIDLPLEARAGTVAELTLTRADATFSERDRDVLDLARPALVDALAACRARERRAGHVIELDGAAEVILADPVAADLLIDAFGPPDHPTWLPPLVADWLALPPRAPLRARGVEVRLLPGPPHLLFVEAT